MASGASAGAVVAGAIIGTEEAEEGIVEASFLGSEEDGIDAVESAEAAGGEASFGFAGRFIEGGDAERKRFGATLFEDAEEVAWLADIKAGEWVEEGENPV